MTDPVILTINLGSTSTKVMTFRGAAPLFKETISHPTSELAAFRTVWDQYDYRRNKLQELLADKCLPLDKIEVIASRGGNIKPVPGGIYLIDEDVICDIRTEKYGVHPCNVGCLIARDLGRELGRPAIIIDPPVTDEFRPEARLTGLPEIQRQSSFHALNIKATARRLAAALGRPPTEVSLILVHLGGGISVGAYQNGRVIDGNNSLDGDGPLAPERAGALPTGRLIDLCFSGSFTREEMRKKITGRGGWVAHLGTADGREVEARIQAGDEVARAVFETTMYQTAKEMGAMHVALGGKTEAIGLTGSLAYSERVMASLKNLAGFIAPIHLYPGENEMEALGAGALRFLRGEESAVKY